MEARAISPEQAKAVWDILVRHGGASCDPHEEHAFVHHVTRPDEPCREYRFMGHLGFGGKFRNNGNNDGVPYVDYYPENQTIARDAVVLGCNALLGELFAQPE